MGHAELTERIATLEAYERELHGRIRALLCVVTNPTLCRNCGREIWMVPTRNGRIAPYTDEALSHFADCPGAGSFRRARP